MGEKTGVKDLKNARIEVRFPDLIYINFSLSRYHRIFRRRVDVP